jgi:hypothetical protein
MQNGFDNSNNEAYSEDGSDDLRIGLSDSDYAEEELLNTQFIEQENEYPISEKI